MSDAQPVHVARLHISSQEWLKVGYLVYSVLEIEEGGEFPSLLY